VEMDLDRLSGADKIINFLESFSKKLKDETGEVTFIVTQSEIEKAYAEAELFTELEKGKWSLKNEPTMTADEFIKSLGV